MAYLVTRASLVAAEVEVYLSRVVKLLVFDLDGTLVDTREDLANSVNHALMQSGFPALPLETVIAAVGDGARNLIERSLKSANRGRPATGSDTDSVLAAFLLHYNEHCLVESLPYPGVAEALKKLKGFRMAVLTNKPSKAALRVLDGLNLSQHFEWILGGDNPYGQKPDPSALNHILASAGIEARHATMIGDGVQDLRVARGAGTHFIGFLSGIGSREALLAEQPETTLEEMRFLPSMLGLV